MQLPDHRPPRPIPAAQGFVCSKCGLAIRRDAISCKHCGVQFVGPTGRPLKERKGVSLKAIGIMFIGVCVVVCGLLASVGGTPTAAPTPIAALPTVVATNAPLPTEPPDPTSAPTEILPTPDVAATAELVAAREAALAQTAAVVDADTGERAAVRAYFATVQPKLQMLGRAMGQFSEYMQNPQIGDTKWTVGAAATIAIMTGVHQELAAIDPIPAPVQPFHAALLSATEDTSDAGQMVARGIDARDAATIQAATELMLRGSQKISDATPMLNDLVAEYGAN